MVVLAGALLAMAFLGIGTGFFLLLFGGPLGSALALPNLMGSLVITVSSAFLILAAGTLLDHRLSAELDAFVAGHGPSPLRNPGLTHAYGLMVLTLLPYLVFLQVFTLEVALGIGREIWRGLQNPTNPSAILLIIPALVVLGTIIGVAVGLMFLVFPPSGEPEGLTLRPRDNPGLWHLSRLAAATLGTRPADVIILSPEPGIGVSSPAGLFRVVGGERALLVGLPSICGLRVGEFAAILTHEYGHIGHRDTQWAAFIGALRTSLLVTLGTIPGPENLAAQPFLLAMVAAFNPAYWTLRIFVILFFRVTGEFSRARETLADLEAATRFGGEVFSRALLRVAANDVVFHELVEERDVPLLLRQGRSIVGFVDWMEQIYRSELGREGLTQIEYRLLETGGQHKPDDLHPGLTERIAATAYFPGEEPPDDRPVEVLFDDWEATDEAVTRVYYAVVTQDLSPAS